VSVFVTVPGGKEKEVGNRYEGKRGKPREEKPEKKESFFTAWRGGKEGKKGIEKNWTLLYGKGEKKKRAH